jgi:hypothetical protein
LRNKRFRFDESPAPSASASASSNASKLTPTAAAKEKITSTVAMLPKELQSTATALATNIFIAYTKWYNKDKKCTAVINDSDNFPNPLNFKIELQLMKEVMGGQASKALSTKLDAAILEARKTLKPFIVRGMELERDHLRRKAIEAVAAALPSLAELLLAYVDGEAYGKHTLVHDFILCHGDDVWSYLNTSNVDFSAIYLEVNELTVLPPTAAFAAATQPPTNNNMVTPNGNANDNNGGFEVQAQYDADGDEIPLSQAQEVSSPLRQSQEAPPPPPPVFRPIINGHETSITALRCLISAIAAAKETYHSVIDENAKALRIAKVMGNQQRGPKTDETAMRLEEEETVPPATLASLTDQKVESKTKPIRQDITAVKNENKRLKSEMEKLKKQMKELSTKGNQNKSNKSTQAKNSPRGAEDGAASPTQSSRSRRGRGTSPSSTTQRGRGRGGASREGSSTPGAQKQRSKSPKSSGRRNRGRGKFNSRLNEN